MSTSSSSNKLTENKVSTTKYGTKELPEFHPRLSMRAAVSPKISEEALCAIEQRQKQPSPAPLETISVEFMSEITNFVGPDGIIKKSIQLNDYAEFMQREVSPSQQILLLKIIVASINSDPELSDK